MIIYNLYLLLKDFLYLIFLRFFYNLNFISKNNYYHKIVEFIKYKGVVFIKLSQIITSRKDLKKYIDPFFEKKLESLQDECFHNEISIISNFKYIKKQPIAAGSICNVFLINHYPFGQAVLKTTHKHILEKISNSIDQVLILNSLLTILNYTKILDILDINGLKIFLLNQIDMNLEARNQIKIKNIFKNIDFIKIPDIYKNKKDYIIMEECKGLKYKKFVEKYEEFEDECIALIYCSLYKMIQGKIIHGDFHHGNFLYQLENNRVNIIILDFGIICSLTDTQSYYLLESMNIKYNKKKRNIFFIKFVYELNYDIRVKLEKYNLNEKHDPDTIINIILKENIKIPSEFISFFTTFQTLIIKINKHIKTKNNHFMEYLLGYALDNDII
ncbi:hypothetical protein CPAV1605_755 [seawater metagenome]|uniref:ABC1 atypical kinase-like domain-containing protein n=1 Tax=seawater metagenome TaxID=1561972 RepID=A0A5E8CMB9_9ZZZZ